MNSNSTENWKTKVSDINLNCFLNSRSCNIVFIVERLPKYTEFFEKFEFGAKLNLQSNVKCLSYTSLLSKIIEASKSDSVPVNLTDQWFKAAALQALHFIDNDEAIPIDLMVLLLKLEVMKFMEADVMLEKKEILKLYKVDVENKVVEVPEIETIDKKDKSKKTETKPNTPKTVDPCSLESLDNSDNLKACLDTIEAPYKHLIITFTGFLEFDLFSTMIMNGVPIISIIEIASTDDQGSHINLFHVPPCRFYSMFQKIEEIEETHTESTLNSSSQHASKIQQLSSKFENLVSFDEFSNLSQVDVNSNVSMSKVESTPCLSTSTLANDCSGLFERFWNLFHEVFEGESPDCLFEDTFHMIYTPLKHFSFKVDKDIDDLVNECSDLFADMVGFICSIDDTVRQYINYMSKMKIWDSGTPIFPIKVDQLKTYTTMMESIPPECFTLPALLYCLVEEVCEKENFMQKSPKIKRDTVKCINKDRNVFPQLDLLLNKHPKRKLLDVKTKYFNVIEEDDVDDEWEKYKMDTNLCRQKLESKNSNKIILKSFRVHEDNHLEKMINFYDKATVKKLFKMNMTVLSNNFPSLLFQLKYQNIVGMKIILNEKDLTEWSKQVKIPKSGLMDVIHVLLFSATLRNTQQLKKEKCNECCKRFPLKTKWKMLEEESVKLKIEEVSKVFSQEKLHHSSATDFSHCFAQKLAPKIPIIDLYGIKYSEDLKPGVLLQQITSAQSEYPNFKYEYIPITDSIVIYFYQSFNKYDFNTEVHDQHLATPVCLRDFCRFVYHENQEWLKEENDKYLENNNHKINRFSRRLSYLICTNSENTQESNEKLEDKKSKKNEKITPAESSKKNKKKQDKEPTDISEDNEKDKEKYAVKKEREKIIPKCASSESPFDFIGYDLGRARKQLSGSTSILHSKDGMDVIIDKTSWLRSEKKFSLKINAQGILMVMQVYETKRDDSFYFHFRLKDDTIILFSRPSPRNNVTSTFCKRRITYEHKERKPLTASAYRKPQPSIEYVLEEENPLSCSIRLPFPYKKRINYSNSPQGYFLKHFAHLNEKILSTGEDNENEFYCDQEEPESDYLLTDSANENLTDRNNYLITQNEEYEEEEQTEAIGEYNLNYSNSENLDRTSFSCFSTLTSESSASRSTKICKKYKNPLLKVPLRDVMLKKLGINSKINFPRYKVISSIFHKNAYMKKIRITTKVHYDNLNKKIRIKPLIDFKPRKVLEVIKHFPFIIPNTEVNNFYGSYELRVSMKSGLLIASIPSSNENSFAIKQSYIDKGPICASVIEEEYRLFLNGSIVIKETSGTFKILNADSSIITFNSPISKTTEKFKMRPRAKINKQKFQTYCYPSNPKASIKKKSKLMNKMFNAICHREILQVDGPNRNILRRERRSMLFKKKKMKKYFIFHKNFLESLDVNVTYSRGEQIKIDKKRKIKTKCLLIGAEIDCGKDQFSFEREDGTHSIIDKEGTLITQFPDGTRIKSILHYDEESVVYESQYSTSMNDFKSKLEMESSVFNSNNSSFVNDEDMKNEEPWQLIELIYEYEHPCFAKVKNNSYDDEITIELSNGTVIHYKEQAFKMRNGESVSSEISCNNVDIISKPCKLCKCESSCSINIKPLYFSNDFCPNKTFLTFQDSHERIFKVRYNGKSSSYLGTKNDIEHCPHDLTEQGKLFVIKRDLSGNRYWDSKLLLRYKVCTNDYTDNSVELYKSSETGEINCIDFKSTVRKAYCEDFLRLYKESFLRLDKYKTTSNVKQMLYLTYRIVNIIPASEKLSPLYGAILKAIERIEQRGTDIQSCIDRLTDYYLHKRIDDLIESQCEQNKPKEKTELLNKSIKPKDEDRQIEIKVPFENEFIQCKKEYLEDFKEVSIAYQKWYATFFDCKCKKSGKMMCQEVKLAESLTNAKSSVCAPEVRDVCEIQNNIPKVCIKHESMFLGSDSIVKKPCAKDVFLREKKSRCSTANRSEEKVRGKEGNNRNMIFCQTLKINPFLTKPQTPKVFDTFPIFESKTYPLFEQNSPTLTPKLRKPFTMSKPKTPSDRCQSLHGSPNSHGDYEVDKEINPIRNDVEVITFYAKNSGNKEFVRAASLSTIDLGLKKGNFESSSELTEDSLVSPVSKNKKKLICQGDSNDDSLSSDSTQNSKRLSEAHSKLNNFKPFEDLIQSKNAENTKKLLKRTKNNVNINKQCCQFPKRKNEEVKGKSERNSLIKIRSSSSETNERFNSSSSEKSFPSDISYKILKLNDNISNSSSTRTSSKSQN